MTQQQCDHHGLQWWPPHNDLIILHKANPIRFEYFDRYIADWSGKNVLDVGCGGGYTCEYLDDRNANVFGTDISENSIRMAQDHATQTERVIDYRPCTPVALPFDDESMDIVTCFDVFEHVDDLSAVMSEISRVLKPSGWLFFDTLNQTFWSKIFVIWSSKILFRAREGGTHKWDYLVKKDSLRQTLTSSGFKNPEFAGIKLNPRSLAQGNLPVKVTKNGNTSILYFGSAKK